jgi:polyhydroxyalkanoate synthesis repressor PhaR
MARAKKKAKKPAGTAAPAPIVIKKYGNRRVYNTATSEYVTLDDLARMIAEGVDFVVVDAKTGADITRSVLTQIIVEREAGRQNMLPTKFLRELIRLYGGNLQPLVPAYLDTAMDTFARHHRGIRDRAAKGTRVMFEEFDRLARHNMKLMSDAAAMFNPAPPPEAPPTGAGDDEIATLKAELARLRDKLDRLAGG